MNKYLLKIASSDLSIATTSKKEEDKAIVDYKSRLKDAKSPELKSAISHAMKEEEDHSKRFGEVIEKIAARKTKVEKVIDAAGNANTVYNVIKKHTKKKKKVSVSE